MEPWQTVVAVVLAALSAIGTALWQFLKWLLDVLKKRDEAFLAALSKIQDDHSKERDELQRRADEQREKRLEDQRKHIETMQALAETLTKRANTTPPSR